MSCMQTMQSLFFFFLLWCEGCECFCIKHLASFLPLVFHLLFGQSNPLQSILGANNGSTIILSLRTRSSLIFNRRVPLLSCLDVSLSWWLLVKGRLTRLTVALWSCWPLFRLLCRSWFLWFVEFLEQPCLFLLRSTLLLFIALLFISFLPFLLMLGFSSLASLPFMGAFVQAIKHWHASFLDTLMLTLVELEVLLLKLKFSLLFKMVFSRAPLTI